jgi:hypothetical protein
MRRRAYTGAARRGTRRLTRLGALDRTRVGYLKRFPASGGRGTRRSLGEPLEQLPVFFDDAAQTRLEFRVGATALHGFRQGLLDGLVQARAIGSGDRLGVRRKLAVESHSEVLSHDVMVVLHRDDHIVIGCQIRTKWSDQSVRFEGRLAVIGGKWR